MKKIFLLITIFAIITCPFSFQTYAANVEQTSPLDSKISSGHLFTVEQVKNALFSKKADPSPFLKSSSMGIQMPNIDVTKVIPISSPTLSSLPNYSLFYEELLSHGINASTISTMTFTEYCAIESTWSLSNEFISTIKKLYPNLSNEDLTTWTYENYENYITEQNLLELRSRFTSAQLTELLNRDILLEDSFYLFKEFHTAENILAQSNLTLKNTLENYYIVKLKNTLGDGVMAEIALGSSESKSNASTLSAPSSLYTSVNFPHYGTDFFRNTVLGTAAKRATQADAALCIKGCLYGISVDINSSPLNCSNMYGTYSVSQNGAHEGIDFAYGTTRTLYSPVEGINLNASTYHQVAIYDASHEGSAKTFSFLHLRSRSTSSSFFFGANLGQQGNEGNSTGYHTHFEVRSGRTTYLSVCQNDHTITSLEPYFVMDAYL